jgi:hypothetical protein
VTMAADTRGPGGRRRSKHLGPAFWAQSVMGSVTGFLTILTLVWRDWIEGVFGFDPDHHSGSFEWKLVAVGAVVTVVLAALARRTWRRAAVRAAVVSAH